MTFTPQNIKYSPPPVSDEDRKLLTFAKVELHVHLPGFVRFSTLHEISKLRGIQIKDKHGHIATTEDEIRELLVTHEPANLSKVLEAFDCLYPVIEGDSDVIERIAYKACETQKNNGVVYFEARYSPFKLTGGKLSTEEVVTAVHRGFERGERDFSVKARSILCCIRGLDAHNWDVLELATKLAHLGVVGIDVAGSSKGADEKYEQSVIEVFKEAQKRGIHRTVHAGESGGAEEVIKAITVMEAERIGHGYRIMQNPALYRHFFIDERNIHLEACPYSSVMTGSVPLNWKNHPVADWAAQDVNFSLSTDDPTCFDNSLLSELVLVHKEIGLSLNTIWKTQVNAAKACFLPLSEKEELIRIVEATKPQL